MFPGGKTRVAIFVVLGILTFNLCVCGMFSRQGSNVPAIGPRPVNASSGSSIRPGVSGSRPITGGSSSSFGK